MVDLARSGSDRAPAHPADLLALFLEHSTDGIVVLDATGHVTVSTPGFERMLGMLPGSLEGTDGLTLVHPDERAEALAALGRMTAFGNASPRPMTFRLAHADGTWVDAELLAAPGHLEDGRMVVTVRDVTGWARAEQALQEAHALQEVVGAIAARFVDTWPEDIDATVNDALGELGRFADVDRAYVFRFSEDLSTGDNTHEWCAPGVRSKIDAFKGLNGADYAQAMGALERGECIDVTRISDLDDTWSTERKAVEERDVRSLLVVPMTRGERLVGCLGLETTREERTWDEDSRKLLRVAADVIGSALARRDAQLESESQEQRFRALAQYSSDQIILLDAEGEFMMVPLGEDIFGYDSEAMVATSALDLVHPDDLPAVAGTLAAALDTPGYRATLQFRVRNRDGVYLPVEVVAVNRLHDPAVAGIVVNLRDMSEQQRAARELRESEERFRTLVGNLPGAVFRCAATPPYADEFVSEAVLDLCGYPAADFLTDRVIFYELVLPGHRECIDGEIAQAISGHGPYVMEYPIRHRDGSVRWISEKGKVSFGPDGTPEWLDGVMFDITARKGLADQLAHDAVHDPLTGLPNRTRLLETLNLALARASRPSSTVATRTGGDEFVVVCSEIQSTAEAEQIADRIAQTMRTPFEIRGREVFVTASIGIAVADTTSSAAELLRDADAAAYRAKERGRNRYELFDETLRAATAAALEVETALHRAIDDEQLLLRYQPVVDLRSGAPVGFEGLLRWQHPERGLLAPAAFLEAAEASGLIVPIGRRVVEMACGTLGNLPDGPPLTMAVNLSPRELAQPDLVERVRRTVLAAGVAPERLCLEITESALLEDADGAVATLAALKDVGVRVAIDDFGTGYSSLNYLRRLPVDVVKIDRSFIGELGRGGAGDTIIAGIIGLALGLGLEVVAEGVEEPAQAPALLDLGCTLGQGFLYSSAVTIEQALTVTHRPAAQPHASGARH